jgi:hypothetical protein
MKLNLPKRQRWLAIGAGTMVALFILDSVLFTPLTKTWQAHAAEIQGLQKSVAHGRSVIERAGETERVWAEMQKNALPKDPAQTEQDMISALDRWGRADSIELGSIRPQWKHGASDRYSLLECRVDATGSLAALSHFVYELERSPLALRIESVELNARDDSGQKLTLALIVSGLRLSPLERKQ